MVQTILPNRFRVPCIEETKAESAARHVRSSRLAAERCVIDRCDVAAGRPRGAVAGGAAAQQQRRAHVAALAAGHRASRRGAPESSDRWNGTLRVAT